MRALLAILFFALSVSAAAAQGCGTNNPNCIVPTAPAGTSDNRAASTAFVTTAVSGGNTVANGKTGQTSFTASLPVLGNGTSALAQGTRSGNTTEFATVNSSTVNGDCAEWDANGNLVDTGAACAGSPNTVANGKTGQTSFTASLPILGNGTSALAQGTRSGNTTEFGTVSGSTVSGDCVKWDANGNLVDVGAPCGTSANTPVYQIFSSPGAVTTLTLTNTPLPSSAGLISIMFDGIIQARDTWSFNTSTDVLTFNAAIPVNVQIVEVDWYAPTTLSGVSMISSSDGSLTISPSTGSVVMSVNAAHTVNWTNSIYSALFTGGPTGFGTSSPTATVSIDGTLSLNGTTISSFGTFARRTVSSGSSDTAGSTDYYIMWNSSSAAAKSESVPGCSLSNDGQTYVIVDEAYTAGQYPITITPASGTIANNVSHFTANVPGGGWTLACDASATRWNVF